MKKITFLLSIILWCTLSFAQTPNWAWVTSSYSFNYCSIVGLSKDGYGNSYLSGYFVDHLTISNVTLNPGNGTYAFLAKLDSNGNCLWAIHNTGSYLAISSEVVTTPDGTSYLLGTMLGTIYWGSYEVPCVGSMNLFLAKIDTNGNVLWVRTATSPSGVEGYHLAMDNNGNIYITGYARGTTTFGSVVLSGFSNRSFIAKIDNEGNWQWAIRLETVSGTAGTSKITTDSNNNCLVIGDFDGSITIGPAQTISNEGPSYTTDIFIIKIDTNGNMLWARKAGGTDNDYPTGILEGPDNYYYLTSNCKSTTTFGNQQFTCSGTDMFLSKLDVNGNWIWTKKYGGTNTDKVSGITKNNSGDLFMLGQYASNITLGSYQLENPYCINCFVAKLNTNGDVGWVISTQDGYILGTNAIIVDNSQNLVIFGKILSAIFGDYYFEENSNSSYNYFIAKISMVIDFPANVSTSVFSGVATINPTIDLNYSSFQSLDSFPSINFTPAHSLVLKGSGVCNITITTNLQWGASYYSGQWHVRSNQAGVIFFENVNFDSKGDVPIILGNDYSLPVTLSSFNAVLTNDFNVRLQWITQSQTNNLGFRIFRGINNNLNDATQITPDFISSGIQQGTETIYNYLDNDVEIGNLYYYWLQSVIFNGEEEFFGPITVFVSNPNDNGGSPTIPDNLSLQNAYPNPFNPYTTIPYTMKSAGDVKIEIYDIRGKIVRVYSNNHQSAGYYRFVWNGCDNNGTPLSSGVYFYKMTSGKFVDVKKVVMVK